MVMVPALGRKRRMLLLVLNEVVRELQMVPVLVVMSMVMQVLVVVLVVVMMVMLVVKTRGEERLV